MIRNYPEVSKNKPNWTRPIIALLFALVSTVVFLWLMPAPSLFTFAWALLTAAAWWDAARFFGPRLGL
jgi:hypothetical protein